MFVALCAFVPALAARIVVRLHRPPEFGDKIHQYLSLFFPWNWIAAIWKSALWITAAHRTPPFHGHGDTAPLSNANLLSTTAAAAIPTNDNNNKTQKQHRTQICGRHRWHWARCVRLIEGIPIRFRFRLTYVRQPAPHALQFNLLIFLLLLFVNQRIHRCKHTINMYLNAFQINRVDARIIELRQFRWKWTNLLVFHLVSLTRCC